jgi:hypothetical protein
MITVVGLPVVFAAYRQKVLVLVGPLLPVVVLVHDAVVSLAVSVVDVFRPDEEMRDTVKLTNVGRGRKRSNNKHNESPPPLFPRQRRRAAITVGRTVVVYRDSRSRLDSRMGPASCPSTCRNPSGVW